MISGHLRDEALLILQGKGAILETAREVSKLLRDAGIKSAVIGGIATVLHGHVRTTVDVDVYVAESLDDIKQVLLSHGFAFDARKREFRKHDVPVPLVRPDELKVAPSDFTEIEGIVVVTLAELVSMKLRSGSADVLRAQDLADVVGLIRVHNLDSGFAAKLAKDIRAEFRKLAKAVQRSQQATGP